MAFAALGAAEMLTAYPGHRPALDLLAAFVPLARRPDLSTAWPWPQPRLSYANAAIAEALIAAGWGLADDDVLAVGLGLLDWLLDLETFEGHLSVTPVGGWAPGEPRPAFDQQPIEVAALADACLRAFELTGEDRWANGLNRAVGWFLGDNDSHLALYDTNSGALHADARAGSQHEPGRRVHFGHGGDAPTRRLIARRTAAGSRRSAR
jgi:hypothetical protein